MPADADREILISELRDLVGERGLLMGEDALTRSCDPFRHVPPATPLIVRPASTQEVSAVLSLCHRRRQRIVTHGGRTGVAGGAYVDPDEIVLSLERMAAVEEIDPVGQWAAVDAGITVEAVQNAVAELDLFYPIDLGSKGSATIGGTIATNAGGNRVIRWGMTRQNVLGIEAVLPDGTIVPAMNRMLKNNSGYDLKQYFIGSEGTLGVVTRAVLKLLPRPRTQFAALISLPGFDATIELLRRARRMPHLSAFEVMWRDYYDLLAATAPDRRPLEPGQPYYVLVEAMGYDEETDSRQFDNLLAGAFDAGLIVDAIQASSVKQIADLWRIRESSDVLVREMSPFVSFDISVDIRSAEAFVEAIRVALAQSFSMVRTVTFGHLGDNNLHLGVHIGPDTATRETEIERCVYAVLERFAGAMTAEHGVGRFKREFLPQHVSSGALEMMRRVRACLDSERLLNREVLF